MPRRTRGAGVTIPAPAAAAANGNAATAHRVMATPLVRHAVIGRPEAAQGRLERPQAAADDLGLPRAGTSGVRSGLPARSGPWPITPSAIGVPPDLSPPGQRRSYVLAAPHPGERGPSSDRREAGDE